MSSDKLELFKARNTSAKGNVIEMHHALRKITLSNSSMIAIIVLPLFFDMLIWFKLEMIMQFWHAVFHFWISHIGLNGQVFYTPVVMFGKQIFVPFPDLPVVLPTVKEVWMNISICLLIMALSLFIPKKFLPLTYLLRAALLVQMSASLYFLISPHSFPYDVGDYISGALTLGIYLCMIIPAALALIYYIFDFAVWKKVIVTAVMLAYFIVLIPFQYMLHALIISSCGLLFMPVLYLFFGLLLETLMFISWYAWAMSRRGMSEQTAPVRSA
jgi:hypothetical protein